jgi:hypothetical protein
MKIQTLALVLMAACHASPTSPAESSAIDAPFVWTAEPLDVGLRTPLCVAVDPRVRDGIWWWQPGGSGCGSRSTGPGMFAAWEATVVRAADGTIDARFVVGMKVGPPREVLLRLEGAGIRALSTGAVVPLARRRELDVAGLCGIEQASRVRPCTPASLEAPVRSLQCEAAQYSPS